MDYTRSQKILRTSRYLSNIYICVKPVNTIQLLLTKFFSCYIKQNYNYEVLNESQL